MQLLQSKMIELKINNQILKVKEETSVLKAAESLGIKIPTMCFLEGFSNHPFMHGV